MPYKILMVNKVEIVLKIREMCYYLMVNTGRYLVEVELIINLIYFILNQIIFKFKILF